MSHLTELEQSSYASSTRPDVVVEGLQASKFHEQTNSLLSSKPVVDANSTSPRTSVFVHRSGSIEVAQFPSEEEKDAYARSDVDRSRLSNAPLSTNDLFAHRSRMPPPTSHHASLPKQNQYSNKSSTTQMSTMASANNSKAVLSALRALQEKIRTLETERLQYSEQCNRLEDNLHGYRQQVEAERRKVDEQVAERYKEVHRIEKQSQEFEVSAARTEERERALLKQLEDGKARDEERKAAMEESQKRTERESAALKEEIKQLTEKVKEVELKMEKKQMELEAERAARFQVDIKLDEANKFIAQCVELNEKLVEENRNVVETNGVLSETLVTERQARRKSKVDAQSRSSLGTTRRSRSKGGRATKRNKRAPISRRAVAVDRPTEASELRRRMKAGAEDAKQSRHADSHLNLKEQLRKANLGKDPPFMPSGNAHAVDRNVYSITQRQIGDIKAYGSGSPEHERLHHRLGARVSVQPKFHDPDDDVAVAPSALPAAAPIPLSMMNTAERLIPSMEVSVGNRSITVGSPDTTKTMPDPLDVSVRSNVFNSPEKIVVPSIPLSTSPSGSLSGALSSASPGGLKRILDEMESEYADLHARYRSMQESLKRIESGNLKINKEALDTAMAALVAKLQSKSEQLMILRRQVYLVTANPESVTTSSPRVIDFLEEASVEKEKSQNDRTQSARGRHRNPSPRDNDRNRSRSPIRDEDAFAKKNAALKLLRQYKEL